MCIEPLPPGGYPIAVKYIISYQVNILRQIHRKIVTPIPLVSFWKIRIFVVSSSLFISFFMVYQMALPVCQTTYSRNIE
jgi:hypothetical protein